MLKACIGLKQVEYLDRRHCGLTVIPEEVYRHERSLEELLLDFNGIQDLPPKFFRLTALRKLSLCENDLNRVPPGIANLTRLVELDISKNAIEDIPQNIQFCRSLHFLDVSSNPLLRTPESLSAVLSLTHLNLNDVGLPRLPTDVGNLVNLKVLEARENTLKSLPLSISKLKKLQRLDVGNNEVEVLPDDIGEISALTELWLDTNLISFLPDSICKLKQLMVLDVTKNRLEFLPDDFSSLSDLSDLHLSENLLEVLPLDIGRLQALTLVKLDLNHLVSLPDSIGRLNRVTELLLYDNMLEAIPPSLFEMQSLEMLNLDRNHILEIPKTVGKCKTLHILSLRENELCELPEEIGFLSDLKVLDIINNRIKCLPLSFGNLDLDALWIDGSQPQPLVTLEVRPDLDNPELNKLYCPFLPQQGPYNSSMENFLEGSSLASDNHQPFSNLNRAGSFSKGARLGVAFDPSLGPAPEEPSKLVRFPTPFRKDMKALKAKRKKYKPEATPSTTIFRKGSVSSKDDLLVSVNAEVSSPPEDTAAADLKKSQDSLGDFRDIVEQFSPAAMNKDKTGELKIPEYDSEPRVGGGMTKMAGMQNLSQEDLVGAGEEEDKKKEEENKEEDMFKGAVYADESSQLPSGSVVRSIEVTIDIKKVPGRTLGFSIAGGRGSTPAYEDVDDAIYVTKIAPGGLAEQDGRLRLGDKLLSVNGFNMVNATHAEAVAALKSVTTSCQLIVSREVLVVLPDEITEEEEEEEEAEQEEEGEEGGVTPVPAEGEGEGGKGEETPEIVAKKLVADALAKSVEKLDEHKEAPPPDGQHDNYINYEIAQSVVKESRQEQVGPKSPDHDSPLRSMRRLSSNEGVGTLERQSRPSISTLDDDEEDYPVERVVLDRSIGRLGLSIVGGADHVSRVFGQGRPGVYVSKISRGGAAMATGKLRLGDRILEVNKFNVRYSTHQQAVQWLISQEGDIELVIQHVPQPAGLQEVVLKRAPNQKLGLSIRGGGKGSKGNPLDPNDEGIFISKLAKGGMAEQSGKLTVGMRIIEVNGVSLLGASHSQAVKALRHTGDLHITVCDGFDVDTVMRRKSLADLLAAEDDRISSVTTQSHVPLSAASSLVLDKAIHGLLSESVDGLATAPRRSKRTKIATSPFFTLKNSKLSMSSTAIGDKPTKEEDFDTVLEDLAKYKLETTQKIKKLDEERPPSTPTSPGTLKLSDIIAPLQNGGLGPLDVDVFGQDEADEESIEAELSKVEIKDTSSMLADLDSEVSTMHSEVSLGEDEINKSKESEDATPKPTRRFTKRSTLSPERPPAEPSPETRRRAAQIRIELSPPPDAEASEAAVKSIIGEVFSDISFEEFEPQPQPWSGRSSGIYTPTSDKLALDTESSIHDLLSALEDIGGSSSKPQEKKEESSSESLEGPEPTFGEVPPAEQRARTMPVASSPPAIEISSASGSEVMLRPPSSGTRDPNKRKSAPVPDVAPKPVKSPEKLTFKEKLALHSKKAKEVKPAPGAVTHQHHEQTDRQTKSISMVVDPATVPPPVNRTSSGDKPASPSGNESLPSTFSDRIAFLRNNQAKSGMAPVEVKKSMASTERRMSSEERRMARVMDEMGSTSAPDVLTTPHHGNDDPTPSLPSNTNSNNNNNNNPAASSSSSTSLRSSGSSTTSPAHSTTYVTQIYLNMTSAPKAKGESVKRGRGRRRSQDKEEDDTSSASSTSKKKAPTTLV